MLSVLYTNLSEKLLVKMPSAKSIRAKNKQHYEKNVEKIKTFSRANSKAQYRNNPAPKKASSRAQYSTNRENKKAASRANSKARYINNPASKKAASRASSKAQYLINSVAKKSTSRRYYHLNKDSTCARKRDRYALVEPKSDVKDTFVKEIEKCMLNNTKAKAQLIKAFKKTKQT